MFKFFDMIGQFISVIVDFVVNTVLQIINLFGLIAKGVVAIGTVLALIPLSLRLLVSAFIAYCIITNILGKGN